MTKISPLIQTYSQFPITLNKGKGTYIFDTDKNKYLDFYGGHAVAIIGHCPRRVIKAIKNQSKQLIFYSNIFKTNPVSILAEKLVSTLLPEKFQVYFANSGSEANETALKIARKFTGKNHLISFKKSFHGRSITSIGVTGIDSYHQFSPNLDEFTTYAELGNIKSVEDAITSDTAAVICEPIQSIGGVKMAEYSFYKDLEKLCKKKNILLIFDEVQTGLGRTGTFWFSQKLGITPDIITTAKGLASGLPISAVLVHESISSKIKVGEHATTFGGGPVVCAAAIATLDTLLSKNFLIQVTEKSNLLISELRKIDQIKKIYGEGLLIGIKLHTPIPDLVGKCLKKGLVIGSSYDPEVFRLIPPLTVSKKEIVKFIQIFKEILIQNS